MGRSVYRASANTRGLAGRARLSLDYGVRHLVLSGVEARRSGRGGRWSQVESEGGGVRYDRLFTGPQRARHRQFATATNLAGVRERARTFANFSLGDDEFRYRVVFTVEFNYVRMKIIDFSHCEIFMYLNIYFLVAFTDLAGMFCSLSGIFFQNKKKNMVIFLISLNSIQNHNS